MSVESTAIEFKTIDKIFAHKVLKGKTCDERCVMALCYLFASAREGYQCLSIEDLVLYPDPKKMFKEEHIDEQLSSQIIEGLKMLPKDVVQEGSASLSLKPVVKHQSHYYLQKYYFLETKIAAYLDKLLNTALHELFSREDIMEILEKYQAFLNKEQQDAIVHSLEHPLSALTGGPGTGKTYAIRYALMIYCALCKRKNLHPRILIAAPTGKATAHLKDKIIDIQDSSITISTLHSALKIRKKEDLHAEPLLLYDLIIIDECSMIDVTIWKVFLSAIQAGSRVILMGDPHQLPPVESGMLFEELVHIIPTVHLSACMRVEQRELISFAQAIKDQNITNLTQLLSRSNGISYFEYERELELSLLNIDSIVHRFIYGNWSDKKRCFLSPILQGPWGVETLNRQIYELLLPQAIGAMTIPIIITQTDYTQEIYNGDLGLLTQHVEGKEGVIDYALFESNKQIEEPLLPRYQYAYALSVHKSQGSEYDEIILFLPEGSQFFGKEVLYTAVTRAKKSVTIIAKKGVLQKCLSLDSKKNCFLASHIPLKGNER